MIRNIIFDLGGVLLNLDLERSSNAFRDLGMNEIDEQFRIGHASGIFKEYEIGTVDDQTFLEALRSRIGDTVSTEAVRDAWNAMLLDFPPERIEYLSRLKNKYRVFLFSNTNGLHWQAFQDKFAAAFNGQQFDDYFEKAYYSHLVAVRKPDLKAYQLVCEEQQLVPAETLFVDDAESNIAGALRAGLQTFHITNGRTVLDLNL
ncbi:MAG TPA: HAD family phosphatase [Chitinophagaceae bacterium]|jgi:putative hydrolase of the HAD superfamily|nr:HAD family phosphatase [Chitinophagaceae bacterium]